MTSRRKVGQGAIMLDHARLYVVLDVKGGTYTSMVLASWDDDEEYIAPHPGEVIRYGDGVLDDIQVAQMPRALLGSLLRSLKLRGRG